MAGGGGREERNRGGWRRKRRPKKENAEEGLAMVKKGLAAVEAAGKRRRQWGLARVAAAGSSEEAREEGEEGAARATAEEGYGQLDATAVVVEEERRWLPGREGGSEVRRASKGGRAATGVRRWLRVVGASAMGSADVTAGGEEWLAAAIEEESKAVVGG
ncbi:hypothetical protein BHE74_00052915 [Ensete ventricosum]|nr:hypothetical protein BHE74_00052915 [Ensete ventricosum]